MLAPPLGIPPHPNLPTPLSPRECRAVQRLREAPAAAVEAAVVRMPSSQANCLSNFNC